MFHVCLDCLKKSLKYTFSEESINISPFSVWALISSASMQELTISPFLFDETL